MGFYVHVYTHIRMYRYMHKGWVCIQYNKINGESPKGHRRKSNTMLKSIYPFRHASNSFELSMTCAYDKNLTCWKKTA